MLETKNELSPHILKTVQGFLGVVGSPGNTDAVFDIADGLRHTDLYESYLNYAYSQPAIVQILKERYLAPTPDLDKLLQYPSDSLGYLYAFRMKEAKLDPEFYRKLSVDDDYSYIALRIRQAHDIWHLVTGFGTDLPGEMGIQAFSLAQTRSPLAVMLLSATVLYTIKTAGSLNEIVAGIQQGWQMGEKAKPFLAQKWEEHWEKPLSEWRAELNVEPIDG